MNQLYSFELENKFDDDDDGTGMGSNAIIPDIPNIKDLPLHKGPVPKRAKIDCSILELSSVRASKDMVVAQTQKEYARYVFCILFCQRAMF